MHLIQGVGGSCHLVTDRPIVLVRRCLEELSVFAHIHLSSHGWGCWQRTASGISQVLISRDSSWHEWAGGPEGRGSVRQGTWRAGGPEVRGPEGQGAWRAGGPEGRGPEGQGAQRAGGLEEWRPGGQGVQRAGDLKDREARGQEAWRARGLQGRESRGQGTWRSGCLGPGEQETSSQGLGLGGLEGRSKPGYPVWLCIPGAVAQPPSALVSHLWSERG